MPTKKEKKEEPKTLKGTVNCGLLNVRKKPDITSEIVTVLKQNSEVKIAVEGSKDEWYKVADSDGTRGYCMKEFITLEK